MFPTSGAPKPPAPAAAPAAPAPAQGADQQQLLAFRKALGVPPNQPAPEAKVIQAMEGKLGMQVKQMAMSLASAAPGGAPGGAPPTTPDAGQPGGQAEPPDPNGPSTANAPSVAPGAGSGGALKSSEIFGQKPVGNIGSQQAEPDEDDEDSAPPSASSIFRR